MTFQRALGRILAVGLLGVSPSTTAMGQTRPAAEHAVLVARIKAERDHLQRIVDGLDRRTQSRRAAVRDSLRREPPEQIRDGAIVITAYDGLGEAARRVARQAAQAYSDSWLPLIPPDSSRWELRKAPLRDLDNLSARLNGSAMQLLEHGAPDRWESRQHGFGPSFERGAAKAILEQAYDAALAERVSPQTREWFRFSKPPRTFKDLNWYEHAHEVLALSPLLPVRNCASGALAECALALDLASDPDMSPDRWRDAAGRRARLLFRLDIGSRFSASEIEPCARHDERACERLAESLPVDADVRHDRSLIALRMSVLRFVVSRPHVDVTALADTTRPRLAALAAVAGMPPDSLLSAWRLALLAEPTAASRAATAEFAALPFWILLLAAAALVWGRRS